MSHLLPLFHFQTGIVGIGTLSTPRGSDHILSAIQALRKGWAEREDTGPGHLSDLSAQTFPEPAWQRREGQNLHLSIMCTIQTPTNRNSSLISWLTQCACRVQLQFLKAPGIPPTISILTQGLAQPLHIWGCWAIPPLQQAGTHCRGAGGEDGVPLTQLLFSPLLSRLPSACHYPFF